MARGFLVTDSEGHNTLALTERATPVLKGAEKVEFRFEQEPAKKAKKGRASKGRTVATSVGDSAESELFERLRALRMALARAAGVPPYVVFHDATLREMALLRPTTLAQLAQLPGIGEKKLERYGERFLALLGGTEGGV